MAELRRERDRVAPEADLVELRLDTVADPDVAGALAGRTTPVIVTCRARWEGGHFAGGEVERLALLAEAWKAGAEYVDVEFAAWSAASWIAKTAGRRLVVSSHDFDGMPADLAGRYAAMCATGAAVVKVAVTAHRLADCLPLLTLSPGERQQHVVLAMGMPGMTTRLVPQRFGSAWTYAGAQVAPGQIPVSPAMHNAAHRAAGSDAVYVPLNALDAADFLAFADAVGLRGASVTLPFKIDVLPHCEADALSRRVGAVNTLARRAGRWVGTNTDVPGLLEPLQSRLDVKGRRATVLGAGGAARGAALALADAGARVTVVARRAAAAAALAADLGISSAPMPPEPGSWDVLVNATSAGMHPRVDDTPWKDARFDGALVYDLVYNPRETRLLREAASAGCATLDGLAMLVAQAERQFEFWTGARPAPGVMRRAAEARLAHFDRSHAMRLPS
jgi:3-dehydroquinate dehydratase/shikimate dehydrogenase